VEVCKTWARPTPIPVNATPIPTKADLEILPSSESKNPEIVFLISGRLTISTPIIKLDNLLFKS
jgi:hypothetical protein